MSSFLVTQNTAGEFLARTSLPADVIVAIATTIALPTVGVDLTDADATIIVTGGCQRTLPAATLTANRVLTLGVTGSPVKFQKITVVRRDATVRTFTVKDNAAATLLVLPVGFSADFVYDSVATHFILLSCNPVQ
jgi:hypothetical protein